jgi:ABC-2 type transport system permease protein
MRSSLGHAIRAFPTLFRVGFAEMVAYRAEFVIWILTTNMPLVMMALWTAVAAEGPVGGFDVPKFEAYYVATLMIRLLTNTWMVWQLTMDIRQGTLATKLLRPLHPLLAYAAEHMAAVPIRTLMVSPLLIVLVVVTPGHLAIGDPVRLAVFVASLVGAWLLLFFMMAIIGSLALFVESATAVFEIWLGLHFILSGYLIPLQLLPRWVGRIADVLPFRYTLSFPVETLIGLRLGSTASLLGALGIQWLYVVGLFAATLAIWRQGMRRFVAFGG